MAKQADCTDLPLESIIGFSGKLIFISLFDMVNTTEFIFKVLSTEHCLPYYLCCHVDLQGKFQVVSSTQNAEDSLFSHLDLLLF